MQRNWLNYFVESQNHLQIFMYPYEIMEWKAENSVSSNKSRDTNLITSYVIKYNSRRADNFK